MTSGVNQARYVAENGQFTDRHFIEQLGSTLVLAPHPDDESLGCGGVIATLRALGQPVHVLFVSDGSMSHPHSQRYPADVLRRVRETEAVQALEILGVAADQVTFMAQKDGQVLFPGSPQFPSTVLFLRNILTNLQPATIFVPWRRDSHRDHRATWHLLHAALQGNRTQPRVLEYPVWLWKLGMEEDQPRPGEVQTWCVDIEAVLPRKRAAIAAHRSQVSRMIDDDPTGFWLSPDLLVYFEVPYEVFFEPIA